jgi:hypothetical protein
MNALVVGAGVATVMAGPPLYGLVQTGQLDGTTAIGRGLLVAGLCAAGASYVLGLVRNYEKEEQANTKHEAMLTALAEAEEAAERLADAKAKAAAATAAEAEKTQRQSS